MTDVFVRRGDQDTHSHRGKQHKAAPASQGKGQHREETTAVSAPRLRSSVVTALANPHRQERGQPRGVPDGR